jgi:hypothetical protein
VSLHHEGARRPAAKSPKREVVRLPVSFRDLCPGRAMSRLTVCRVVNVSRHWAPKTQALPHSTSRTLNHCVAHFACGIQAPDVT